MRWLVAAGSVALIAFPGSGVTRSVAASPPLVSIRAPLPKDGPKISAPAAILIDAGSGAVLYTKRPQMRRPIASTTKIMTAIVAMGRLHPGDVVRVPREATRVEPYREGLRKGEYVPAWKLFYGLLLVSGNDTAVTLAVAAGGTRLRFIRLMNEKARSLGLWHTHFRSASGLIDNGNYSTALDLAALTRYAMRNPHFRSIVGTKYMRVWWRPPTRAKLYQNHNKLLWRYPGADGVKTGWTTRAGSCLVASAHRHGIELITVVLDSPDHYGDTVKLLDYGFKRRG